MHDLIIRGGTVIDGTGAPARQADVAIAGGVIVAVGRAVGDGREEIDESGLIVTTRLGRHPHPLRSPGHLGRPLTPAPRMASRPSSWATVESALLR